MNRADEAKNPVMAELIKNTALGRRGTTEEIANVTAFLTSPDASLMTGAGTNSYLVGSERLVAIDPGPDDAEHVGKLAEIAEIVITAARLLDPGEP